MSTLARTRARTHITCAHTSHARTQVDVEARQVELVDLVQRVRLRDVTSEAAGTLLSHLQSLLLSPQLSCEGGEGDAGVWISGEGAGQGAEQAAAVKATVECMMSFLGRQGQGVAASGSHQVESVPGNKVEEGLAEEGGWPEMWTRGRRCAGARLVAVGGMSDEVRSQK